MTKESIYRVINALQAIAIVGSAVYLGVRWYGPTSELPEKLDYVSVRYDNLIAMNDTLIRVTNRLLDVAEKDSRENAELRGLLKDPMKVYLAETVDSIRHSLRVADSVGVRLRALEEALQATPEKALALPLIRNDLDVVRDRLERSEVALVAQMQAVDDRTQSLVTMSFFLLGLMGLGTIKELWAWKKQGVNQ